MAMNTSENTSPTVMGGLKVLEISSMVSAPFCGKLLASLGADVDGRRRLLETAPG